MTMTTSVTTITPAEFAERLPEIVERIRRGRESFMIAEVDGTVIADVTPRATRASLTLHQLLDYLIELGEVDPAFADDVRWARDDQGYPRVVDWPD